MEKNKIHQILSNYNNLSEQKQNCIQELYAAGQATCEEIGTIDAMKQVLPLELTKIWGRSHNNIDKYELESIYRFFERMMNNRDD